VAGPGATERAAPVRIGALTDSWGPTPAIVGLRDGLVALGYRENTSFVLGIRFTEGDAGALPAAARELAQRGVDLIFAAQTNAAKAAQAATERIPIVFTGGGDPIRLGLIESFARPGGRVTGVASSELELAPKRLEIFHQMVPGLKKVLFVHRVTDDDALAEARAYRGAAGRLGIALVEKPVKTQDEARMAIAKASREEVNGIISPSRPSLNIPGYMLEATKRSIPTMFHLEYFVERGGLASYSSNGYESGRLAARLVDKVLKGEKPGQIPVETNSKIELIINMKVVKALRLTIAPDLLLRADRILE
jgi:putative ABC transport system substrate-binding protein